MEQVLCSTQNESSTRTVIALTRLGACHTVRNSTYRFKESGAHNYVESCVILRSGKRQPGLQFLSIGYVRTLSYDKHTFPCKRETR